MTTLDVVRCTQCKDVGALYPCDCCGLLICSVCLQDGVR